MPALPTSNPEQFVQAAPVLFVRDVKATATFYRDILGFTWDADFEDYCVVWRDNAAVHFATGSSAPTEVQVFLWVQDVDRYHDEVLSRGAEIASPPEDRSYGIRDFSLRDPNGVTLFFGQDIY